MKFTETELHPDLVKAATGSGFETLTEIQEKCLIPALEGRDIAGISQTGTGKTVAFLLPVLDSFIKSPPDGIAALIVTPTRELCLQIAEEAEKLSKANNISVVTIYGGDSYKRQEADLATNPAIIVATPGRLIDYLKQGKISLSALQFLILDEADRMFDMGFIRDIRYIMKKAPEGVQTMLFSATMSYYIMRLASDFMKNPVEVRIEAESVAVDKIDQQMIHLGREEKLPYLLHILLNGEGIRAIIFTNLKSRVTFLERQLHRHGIHAMGISSLLDQKKRVRLLKEFKLGKFNVLIATDVASRGIDVDDITHVFNFDLPQDSESYVHRIGRTARAGKTGTSISFCSEDDYDALPKIERFLGMSIPVSSVNKDYLDMPRGNFTPFRPAGAPSLKEKDTKSERPSRKKAGGRKGKVDNRKKQDGRNNEQTANRPEVSTAEKPSRKRNQRRRPTAAVSEGESIRNQDRARLLKGENTSENNHLEHGQPDREDKRSNRPGGKRPPKRQRRDRTEQRGQGRNRPSTKKNTQRQRTESSSPQKTGILSKIKGLFKKN